MSEGIKPNKRPNTGGYDAAQVARNQQVVNLERQGVPADQASQAIAALTAAGVSPADAQTAVSSGPLSPGYTQLVEDSSTGITPTSGQISQDTVNGGWKKPAGKDWGDFANMAGETIAGGVLTAGLAPELGAGLAETAGASAADIAPGTIGADVANAAGGLAAGAGKSALTGGDPLIGAASGGLGGLSGAAGSAVGGGIGGSAAGSAISAGTNAALTAASGGKQDPLSLITSGISGGISGGVGGNNVSGATGGGIDPMTGAPSGQTDVSGTGGTNNVSGVGITNNPAGVDLSSLTNGVSGAGSSSLITGEGLPDNVSGAVGGVSNISGNGSSNNVSGQSGLTSGLKSASGVADLGQTLQGLLNGLNTSIGNTVIGTNEISTPVTAAQASAITPTGSWTDRQLYDAMQAIQQRYVQSGQSGSPQEQAEIQALLQQQVG